MTRVGWSIRGRDVVTDDPPGKERQKMKVHTAAQIARQRIVRVRAWTTDVAVRHADQAVGEDMDTRQSDSQTRAEESRRRPRFGACRAQAITSYLRFDAEKWEEVDGA